MAKIHGKKAKFWLVDHGGTERDLSNYLNSIDFPMTGDTAETSGFGDEDKTFVVGLKSRTIRGAGLNSYSNNEPDHVLAALVGGGANGTATPVFKWAPGGSATGLVYYTGSCIITNYSPGAQIGAAQAFTFDAQVTGSVTRTTFS